MRTVELTNEEAQELSGLWWLFALIGVASLVAGAILVARPSHSVATLAVVAGIFLLLDGVFALAESFRRDADDRALGAIVGVLGIIVGIGLVRHPFHGAAAIGLLLGIWLVAAGVIRFVRAIVVGVRPLLSAALAVLEVAVGIAIVSDPHIGYTTLAVLAGVWLLLNGFGTLLLAYLLRSLQPRGGGVAAEPPAPAREVAGSGV
jgi:uncharacterized membrane protein HdeD (DUF308 family)